MLNAVDKAEDLHSVLVLVVTASLLKCLDRKRKCCPDPPKSLADPHSVERAVNVLRNAKSPLVVIGKGTTSTNIVCH